MDCSERDGRHASSKIKTMISIMLPVLMIVFGLLVLAYVYRPVCHDTNMNLNHGGKCQPLYACENLGFLEYLK